MLTNCDRERHIDSNATAQQLHPVRMLRSIVVRIWWLRNKSRHWTSETNILQLKNFHLLQHI